MFVATKLLLQNLTFVVQNFCRDKHAFVATKDVFCRGKHVFVVTKMILVAASNDTKYATSL